MIRVREAVALAVALQALLVAGCAGEPVKPLADAPAPLGRDFFARQSVVARFEDEERRFEIVLQSRCGDLRIVALSTFGMRLFSAVRNAEGLEIDALAGAPLPFPPERVLRDVERTFFRSLAPAQSGEQVVRFAGERVEETWLAGRLTERRVITRQNPEGPPLVIRYSGALGPADVPERVDLTNAAVGYALEIRNHQVEELRCTRAP